MHAAASIRRRVHGYFLLGCQRSRAPVPAQALTWGRLERGPDRLAARFYLHVDQGRITVVHYQCSLCVVLVAYCEYLAQRIGGLAVDRVARITAAHVIAALPEVPACRHDRAELAVRALRSALHAGQRDLQAHSPWSQRSS